MPWRNRAFGGFPSAKINYLSLITLFTENVPQIAVQLLNAKRSAEGLKGVALVSVVISAMAIVVKTLMKVFEGITGGDDGPTRPRGKTRAEIRSLRQQLEAQAGAVDRGFTVASEAMADLRSEREENDKLRKRIEALELEQGGGGGGGGAAGPERNSFFSRFRRRSAEERAGRSTALSGAVGVELAVVNPMRRVDKKACKQEEEGRSRSSTASSAKHDYVARGEGEVSMVAGDDVEVLAPDNAGWTRVRNVSRGGDEGLVPTSYLLVNT
jgi:hypothetical protein